MIDKVDYYGMKRLLQMPASGEKRAQTVYCIRLNSNVAQAETDPGWLLDAVRLETDSEAGVLYEFRREACEVNSIATRSEIAAGVKTARVTLTTDTSQWIDDLVEPVQGGSGGEPNFEKFPEVLQYGLKRLLIAPLRTEEHLLGLLTLGRTVETSFDPAAIEVVHRTARLLTAVLERDFLQRKLLERKVVERAKGILQQRRRLSEEQAYLLLRNDSRRRGIPMIDLAKEIIEKYAQPGARFQPEVWRLMI